MKVLDWVCKLIAFPFFMAGLWKNTPISALRRPCG